ncbi:MAG: hypothetical protein HY869_18465 [Chloroflexi bacterium]|nr:hypothetical protein [Chloroflexota bacterium]
MIRYFAFSSGGAYHFHGFGEWKLHADENGHLMVEHDVLGSVTKFGPFQLSVDETDLLWGLISGAAFEQRPSSPGPGIPDEAMLGFALSARETLHSVQLWNSDAFGDKAIVQLLNEIVSLIERYTGRKPVLR